MQNVELSSCIPQARLLLTRLVAEKNIPLNVMEKRPVREGKNGDGCTGCGSHSSMINMSVDVLLDDSWNDLQDKMTYLVQELSERMVNTPGVIEGCDDIVPERFYIENNVLNFVSHLSTRVVCDI